MLSAPSRVEKYIGLDLKDNIYQKPDVEWDGRTIPLADNSIDCALAMEVLEHCPEPEVVLREALRVLKPGSSLFLTVPFVWPLHDVPHDEYRYTPFALSDTFGTQVLIESKSKPTTTGTRAWRR